MDSLTQIVLGASVGEAILGKKVGYRAAIWGAIAGTIPDLDVLAKYLMNPIDSLLVHRGFSHSILFCLLAAPLMGFIVHKIHKNQSATVKDWSWLFFWGFYTHPLLDAFTTWGTQLFWPIESRLAFKSIFVIDPVYTLPFLLFLLLAITQKKESPKRHMWNRLGLLVSTSYLLLTFLNKLMLTPVFEAALDKQGIQYTRIETKPMPLQNFLWTANVEADSGYYIGYYSRFDRDKNVRFHYYPHNKHLLEAHQSEAIAKAIFMTQNWYAVDLKEDTFVIHDLRFGIMGDFNTGEGEFVFDYLAIPFQDSDSMDYHIEQKRNSFENGAELFDALSRRIKGN